MNLLFSGAAARAARRSAHACLDDLTALLGAGLTAVAAAPALLAALDQHVAGVRDSLQADTRPLTAVVLAAYAEGVRDAAARHGWTPPGGAVDWAAPDWVLLRLLAVCALARTLPPR